MRLQRERGVRTFEGSLAEGIASMPGWVAATADLPLARRETHDALIRLLGSRREGAVYWRWEQGTKARELLDEVHPYVLGADHENDVRRRMHAMLREYGGWIVVAFCAASEPS